MWLFSGHVGILGLIKGRLIFKYTSQWLQCSNATLLSCSLPLRAEAFDDQLARPFFAGLLLEGKMWQLIAQQLQVCGQNDFTLLDYLGGQCAGAVTFQSRGQLYQFVQKAKMLSG